MNHQERIELLDALVRAGVSHYKSLDLEIKLGGGDSSVVRAPVEITKQDNGHNPAAASNPPSSPNPDATEKLKSLISTLKMDDASLIDKIFPAGAGG